MTYTWLERKSTRERYIRVAAIDIIIIEGNKNIYVARTHKKLVSSSTHSKQRRTILNASGFGRRVNILRC